MTVLAHSVHLITPNSEKTPMSNSGNSPESPKQGLKITLMQGIIGAASLAGTTAIPLLVQRALTPTPTPSPAQIQPAQMTPAPTSSSDWQGVTIQGDDTKGKGKKKGKKHD